MRVAFTLAPAVLLLCPNMASAQPPCTDASFAMGTSSMKLKGDCRTDATIVIPDGFTLNGAGFTITAVDPAGGHFVGGVVRNGGPSASVMNLIIDSENLANVCDAGADRLRGILFDGASGKITNTGWCTSTRDRAAAKRATRLKCGTSTRRVS